MPRPADQVGLGAVPKEGCVRRLLPLVVTLGLLVGPVAAGSSRRRLGTATAIELPPSEL